MNVLITGASRGIGRELVLKFAQNANNNIVVFTSNTDKLEALANECLKKYNNRIIFQLLEQS